MHSRLFGLPEACRPNHLAGGDDAGQRLPSLQGRAPLCAQSTQALPPQPYRNPSKAPALIYCSNRHSLRHLPHTRCVHPDFDLTCGHTHHLHHFCLAGPVVCGQNFTHCMIRNLLLPGHQVHDQLKPTVRHLVSLRNCHIDLGCCAQYKWAVVGDHTSCVAVCRGGAGNDK